MMYIKSMSSEVAKVLVESEKIQVIDKLLNGQNANQELRYDKLWQTEMLRRKAEMDSIEVKSILGLKQRTRFELNTTD